MVMVIPSLKVLRDGTAVPDRSDGGLGCSSNPDQSPQLGDGTCRLSMCRWKSSADDTSRRHGTSSQAKLASTPEAIWDQQSSGGPSEKYQCTGAGDEEWFRSVPPVLYEEQPSLGATGNCQGVAPCAANAAIARVVALNGAL